MRLQMIKKIKAMDELPEIRKLVRNILAEYDDLNIVRYLSHRVRELRVTTNRHAKKKQPDHIMHKLEDSIKCLETIREYRNLLVNSIEAHISVGEKMKDELKNEYLPQFVEFLDDLILNNDYQRLLLELKDRMFELIEIQDWETLISMIDDLMEHEHRVRIELFGMHVCRECGYSSTLDESYSEGEFSDENVIENNNEVVNED
ncbi:unnamed protein product [Caenorhabditis angaria]|uniref:Uncharacterized protein n=1 Tax=Caenorhabditis angaria TaxID=860376 RepID=A0A9P1J2Z7_9PELO|nr:unnamed protein product [Caenorhabditis angaria]